MKVNFTDRKLWSSFMQIQYLFWYNSREYILYFWEIPENIKTCWYWFYNYFSYYIFM